MGDTNQRHLTKTGIFLLIQFIGCFSAMIEPPLKVCAFNIRSFGLKKMSDPEVVSVLTKIIQRYDITLVQEIKDSSQVALPTLLANVNNEVTDDTAEYAVVTSERLGSSHSQEQYGFIYRRSRVEVSGVYQYPTDNDKFERSPFTARFRVSKTEISDFAIIAIHTKPLEAVKEINNLVDVYDDVSSHWPDLKNVLIAGDFNADCSYVSGKAMQDITLKKDDRFTWLIDDGMDTTSGHSDCSYDRFVVAGDELTRNVVGGSAGVFRYDEAYGLNPEKTLDVSDHYPIEMEIKGKVDKHKLHHFSSSTSVTIKDDHVHDRALVRRMSAKNSDFKQLNFTVTFEYETGSRTHSKATKYNLKKAEIIPTLELVRATLSGPLISNSAVELIQLYLDSTLLSGSTGGSEDIMYDISVICEYKEPCTCEYKITRHKGILVY